METTVKAVHFSIDDLTKEFLDHKLEKMNFAADKIQDLDFTFTKDKTHNFELEAKIHFRWGVNAIVKTDSLDLRAGLDKLVDKVDLKIRKEVDKVQDHTKNGKN